MIVNLWLALSTTARDAINARLDWDDEQGAYTGPVTDTEAEIFRAMADRATVQSLFRAGTFAGKDWVLYTVYIKGSARAKQAIDYLAANRPGHFRVLGAWDFYTGEQIKDGNGDVMYPIPAAQLLKLLPTIKTYNPDGTLASETEPVALADINLLQGQAPRLFA